MLNKKLGLFVMSAAMLGLVACGGGQSSATGLSTESKNTQAQSASGESGQESKPAGDLPAIPEVEGKIAVYFTYQDVEGAVAAADIPEWCSPFITGIWNGWGTSPDQGALEMKALEGNDHVFYTYLPADADFGEDNGYQITLGYNAASGVGTAKQGINWTYKTIYSDENFPGVKHPVLTKMSDKVYAALNTDHPASAMAFAAALPEPISAKDTFLKFKVDLGDLVMGDNLEFVVKGSFNGWTTVSVGLPDNKGYYYIPLGDEVEDDEGGVHHEIIVGTYEMCFGVRNKLIGGDMEDKYTLARQKLLGEEVEVMGGDEEPVYAADDAEKIVSYTISNIVLGMSALDGDEYVYNAGTLCAPVHAKGTLENFMLPSNDAPLLSNTYVIRLKNTGTALENAPYIAGGFTGWEHVLMDTVAAGTEWECVVPENVWYVLVEQSFKFTDGQWNSAEVAPANAEGLPSGNFAVKPAQGDIGVEISADLSGWNGAVVGTLAEIDELLLPAEYVVEFRVHNITDGIPTKVTIAGNFLTPEWTPASNELTKDAENGYYAIILEVGGMKAGAQLQFKITDGTWDHAIGKGSDNYVETLSYGRTIYDYDGDLVTFTGDLVPHVVAAE